MMVLEEDTLQDSCSDYNSNKMCALIGFFFYWFLVRVCEIRGSYYYQNPAACKLA